MINSIKNGDKLWHDLSLIMKRHGMEGAYGIAEQLVGNLMEKGTAQKAPDLSKQNPGSVGYLNLIPSSIHGKCNPDLVVLCYNKDNLHERLREMTQHAGIICDGVNRNVLFITSHWHPDTFEIQANVVEALRMKKINIIFVLISKQGASELPF